MPAPTAPHVYIECDIPAGMTLVEWRRTRPTRTTPVRRVVKRRTGHLDRKRRPAHSAHRPSAAI